MPSLMPFPCIFFLFLATLSSSNCSAENDHKDPEALNAFSVSIDAKTQANTGIKTQKLFATQFNPEIEVFATRVDLTPLINIHSEYSNILAKQKIAHLQLEQTKKTVRNLQNLQREKAVSMRKLITQQTQLKIDQTAYDNASQQAENIRLISQSQWGPVLSQWILTTDHTNKLQNIVNRTLYLIYLPLPATTPNMIVFIQPFGDRELAQPLSLLATAPAILATQQQIGTPYLYLSETGFVSPHLRVTAWLPESGNSKPGVIIPASSLVWYLGQAFVYLQVDAEHFKRVQISDKNIVNTRSYFIPQALQADDLLVVSGTQMLLSEELRSQIPAEDDD